MTSELPPVTYSVFTESQRRRVEALILIRWLFPSAMTGLTQFALAHWITKGRLPEDQTT